MNDETVFIVDDDVSICDSLALLLGLRGFKTQLFVSAQAFLSAYQATAPGCLLVDVRMPGMSGLELQQELATRGIGLPIIVMTAHGDVSTARAALKAGAVDYLEKPLEDELLLDVLRHAIDLDRRARRDEAAQQLQQARLARLTMRERQVMEQVALGNNNREIAATLQISPRTVEVYKARMLEKLDARSLADVIRIAMEESPEGATAPVRRP